MKKWVIPTLVLFIIAITIAVKKRNDIPLESSPLQVSSGNLYRTILFSPELNDSVIVDIWNPEDYNTQNKYPVIYMHDGQNLFDASSTWNHQAWEIDSVVNMLITQKKIMPPIIVGIHSVQNTRIGDLMPEKPLQYLQNDTIKSFINMMCRGNYRADEYLSFIVNTLKPVIDSKFASDTSLIATSIMGSSMGGLISIYAMCEYPDVFGSAACLSTHWTGALGHNNDFPSAMSRYIIENLPEANNHRLYMDNGSCPYDSVYIPYFRQMVELADSLGYKDVKSISKIYPGHRHDEYSWSQRVAIPLEYILTPLKH